jgi:hypothetical protein
MGRRERAEIWGFGWSLGRFLVVWVFGGTSEKGSTRKDTENWVTRRSFLLLGEFWILR